MNTEVTEKIRMYERSLHCFIFGLLGLLPLIGIPFALAALWISGRARVQEKKMWNPARRYRIFGLLCAAFGTVVWSGILILIIFHAVMDV
jgi:hypothetical protein